MVPTCGSSAGCWEPQDGLCGVSALAWELVWGQPLHKAGGAWLLPLQPWGWSFSLSQQPLQPWLGIWRDWDGRKCGRRGFAVCSCRLGYPEKPTFCNPASPKARFLEGLSCLLGLGQVRSSSRERPASSARILTPASLGWAEHTSDYATRG